MLESKTYSHNEAAALDSSPSLNAAHSQTLWRNRSFLFVFTSYSLSLLGNTFHSIALNLWVLQTSGSAKLMSAVLITHLVVSMLFSSVAGTIADRINRRLLMWSSDFIRFVLVAIIALLIYLENTSYIAILALTALVAFVGSFRAPAFQAALIEIVGKQQIAKAVAAINISDNLVRILGFAAGGAAVAFLGGAIAIAIDAAAFLISAILVMLAGSFRYEAVKAAERSKTSFKEDLIEGFRFALQHKLAKASLIILPVVMLFFLSTFMLIQVMAVQVWRAGAVVFGLIEMCIPLGYVIGSLLIMGFDKRIVHKGRIIALSIILMGGSFVLISFIEQAFAALPFILLVGFLFSFSTTIIHIELRSQIAPELQGRISGLLSSATSVAPPLGLAIFSALSDLYGPAVIIAASGGMLLLTGLLLSRTISSSYSSADTSA